MIKPLEIVGESPLPAKWIVDFNNLDERMKTKMEETTLELGNLIAASNLGFDV